MPLAASSFAPEGGEFRSPRRMNSSLTAGLEKKALTWLALRAPGWVTSDQLTLLGLLAQFGGGAFYFLARGDRHWLLGVVVCIALNWLGDSLDGTLARVRNRQRPRYGFYVDHVVDVVGATALMCGLGFSGLIHGQIAIAMLLAFLLISAESYLAACTLSCFRLSQGIFGPTEIRILLIVGNLALLRSPYATLFGLRFLLFDAGGTVAAVAMVLLLLITAARHSAELYRKESLS